MDFSPPPHPFGLDLMTLNVLFMVTFLVQSVVIGFHAMIGQRYPGLRTFLVSVLLLAAGSLVLVVQGFLSPGPAGVLSNALVVWGAALQYLALARFLGRQPHRWLVWGWPIVMSLALLAMAASGPNPLFAFRELLPLPLLFAAAWVILRSPTKEFRAGAVLTALPFLGYALRLLVRLVLALLDPQLQRPGPNVNHSLDALAYFVFSFLWTSGFLLMINQRLQSALLTLASEDPLTTCLNRRAMTSRLEEEHIRLQRYGRPYSVILLDLDRFKRINDTMGHDVGDRVLVAAAAALRKGLRTGDALARWGGEEFLVLLPETPEAEAHVLGERLRLLIEAQAFDRPGLAVTVSGGVAGARPDQTMDEVCVRADRALYAAKETRNRIVVA